MNQLIDLDQSVTQVIYFLPHNQLLDTIFHFFSASGVFVIIWIGIFVFLVIYEEIRHHRFFLDFFSSILVSSILTNLILKNIFHRLRPLSLSSPPLLLPPLSSPSSPPLLSSLYPTDYSFPSGHATFAFAAAYVLSKYDKKRAFLYYSIAVLIAFSRVYLGFHYVGDVLAGGLIGIGVGIIVVHVLKKETSNF